MGKIIYPRIEINIGKIRENTEYVVDYCGKKGIEIMGISKGICAMPQLVEAMVEGGIRKIGDSRIQNIVNMVEYGINAQMYLIRIPMLCEIDDLVKYTLGSLNSELDTIKAISESAKMQNKIHNVILMVDVGDLREGVWPDKVLDIVGEIIKLPNIKLEGLGANVGCYGGVLPTYENTKILVDLANDIEKEYGLNIETISGGSTLTLDILEKGEIAKGITQFRIGEAILLGRDTTNFRIVPGTIQDTVKLKAQVIEVKTKPSVPIGKIGRDAFGNIPNHKDMGNIKRAIVAVGKQDCRIDALTPVDKNIEIMGGSSDHLLLNISNTKYDVNVGDIVEFDVFYSAMLSLMTSKYVNRSIVG